MTDPVKVGDTITVVPYLEEHLAVGTVTKVGVHAVYYTTRRSTGWRVVALASEGVTWCRGQADIDVRALMAATALRW